MESVAAGPIGWNCHRKVLHLPSSSCFSPRRVVSLVNIASYHNYFVQFSLRSSTVPLRSTTVTSRRMIIVGDSKQQVSSVYKCNYFTNLEGTNYDYDNAIHAKNLKSSAARNCNKFVDTLSRFLASFLSYGLLVAFTITVNTLYTRNSALAASPSYDRIGGSSSLLSSLLSSSSSSSLSSTYCEKTSPSIHVNIVFPYVFQLCASVTVTLLANLFSLLHPLDLRGGSFFFFQVAVSDKEHTLRRRLKKIAENADTSTLNGLNYLLKEVVKALLQYNDSSIHFTVLCESYGLVMNLRKWFEQFLNKELRRDDVEYTLLNTLVKADDNAEYKNKTSMVKSNSNTENVYTVVTVLVLATGKHEIPCFTEKGRCCHDSFEVLQTLKRIPINEIQSVEVLWSPRKDNEVLLEDELLTDFPMLRRIENGIMYMTSM